MMFRVACAATYTELVGRLGRMSGETVGRCIVLKKRPGSGEKLGGMIVEALGGVGEKWRSLR